MLYERICSTKGGAQALTENPSDITNDTQESWKYLQHRKQLQRHFSVGHGNKTISIFLPTDGKTSYLLATSNFGILNIGWYSAIRKHLFLP